MPSKTSKPKTKPPRPKRSRKAAPGSFSPPSARSHLNYFEENCSEERLGELACILARDIRPGDRVLLEGELGAGKTTFARALLLALGVSQPPEGSPTFAIAHEYEGTPPTRVVHLDLYRLKSEREIDDAGIPEYFWDPHRIVICEWLSIWSGFEADVLKSGRNWSVKLTFSKAADRDVEVSAGFSKRL